MRGRLQDNQRYCEKESVLIEWGQKPDQGRRTDIVGLKHKLTEGHHPMDLAIEDEGFTPIVAKFSRFAQELYQHARFKKMRINHEVPEVYIRIGPPGTGKTRWLDEQYGLDQWIESGHDQYRDWEVSMCSQALMTVVNWYRDFEHVGLR